MTARQLLPKLRLSVRQKSINAAEKIAICR
jgi:hypothetical protein